MRLPLAKTSLAMGAIAALALTLGACSSDSGSSQADSNEFTLAFQQLAGDESYQNLVDAYMADNPGQTITLKPIPLDGYAQALRTQLRAGSAPDVFYVTSGEGSPHGAVALARDGVLEALPDEAAATLPPGAENGVSYDGKVYAQSFGNTVVGMITNDAVQKNVPATLDQLKSSCAAVKAGGVTPLALAGAIPDNTALLADLLAGTYVYADEPDWNDKRAAGDTTFADTPGWRDALQAIVDLNDAGCFQEGAAGAGFEALSPTVASGASAAFFAPGSSARTLAANNAGLAVSMNALPGQKSGEGSLIYSASDLLAVNKATKNQAAIDTFLTWLRDPANAVKIATITGNLPFGTNWTASDVNPLYAPVVDQVLAGKTFPLPNTAWASGDVYRNLGIGVQGLLTGQATIDQVLKSMDDAW